MIFLAIDTAGSALKVLLNAPDKQYFFYTAEYRTASESLLPQIDRLLGEAGMKLAELDFLACVIGPGSFTGIRIGMATTKAFAYALGLKVKAVNTLDVLAYNNCGECEKIISVCDAGNGFRYAAVYDCKMNGILEPKCFSITELEDFLKQVDGTYELYVDDTSRASLGRGTVPDEQSFCAALKKAATNGNLCDYNDIEPMYIRKPQAERDLESR